EVILAADGAETLRLVEQERRFDLFVLDVMMPEMSGDELSRQLRSTDPDARVLYFTGYSDHLFTEKHTLAEHESFVDKSVTPNGLLEAVSLMLFGHTRGPKKPPSD